MMKVYKFLAPILLAIIWTRAAKTTTLPIWSNTGGTKFNKSNLDRTQQSVSASRAARNLVDVDSRQEIIAKTSITRKPSVVCPEDFTMTDDIGQCPGYGVCCIGHWIPSCDPGCFKRRCERLFGTWIVRQRDCCDPYTCEMDGDLEEGRKFDITNLGQVCSEIGRIPVKVGIGCKEAATELGKSFHGESDLGSSPNGCILQNNKVYWNVADAGSREHISKVICNKNETCSPNPCLNNGTCKTTHADGWVECQCEKDYFGFRCEYQQCVDEDSKEKCKHRKDWGMCAHTKYYAWCKHTCGCDTCYPNPCKNNGKCKTHSSGWIECLCKENYYGLRCEYENAYTEVTGSHCLRTEQGFDIRLRMQGDRTFVIDQAIEECSRNKRCVGI